MMKRIILSCLVLGIAVACSAREAGQIVLTGEDALIEGTSISYWNEDHHLGHWSHPEDIIRFNLPELDAGRYKVIIKYACPDECGGKVSVKLNQQEFSRTFGVTGSWNRTVNKPVGSFEHDGGPVEINLTILMQNRDQIVIDLHALILQTQNDPCVDDPEF